MKSPLQGAVDLSLRPGRCPFPFRAQARRKLAIASATASLALSVLVSCGREKPPAPRAKPAAATKASQPQFYLPDTMPALLTFAGERGTFKDTSKLEDIPEGAKGLVRIAFLDQGQRAPAGKIWVANLRQKGEQGYALSTIPREDFELAALGQGLRSQVELPEGLELPKVVASQGVVVYKTVWCGVCTKLQQYLKQKGVEFVAKDIEKDKAAAAELAAKAKKAGISLGSVPVIDVRGEMMVGFDRSKLDRLLAAKHN